MMQSKVKSKTNRTSFLFVCTGNICRSPTAEAVLRHRLADARLDTMVRVDSAATMNFHEGEAADARSIAAARRRGYRMDDLRSRRIQTDDFHQFSHILAMGREHLDEMIRISDGCQGKAKLELFMRYANSDAKGNGNIKDIPDPYYDAIEGFDRVLDMIEFGCDGIIRKLKSDL